MHLFKIKNAGSGEKDEEAKKYAQSFNYKYTEVISEIGFGKYQYKLLLQLLYYMFHLDCI